MTQTMMETTFKEIPIGGRFRQSKGIESGLLHQLDEPGSYLYEKESARKLRCIGYQGVLWPRS